MIGLSWTNTYPRFFSQFQTLKKPWTVSVRILKFQWPVKGVMMPFWLKKCRFLVCFKTNPPLLQTRKKGTFFSLGDLWPFLVLFSAKIQFLNGTSGICVKKFRLIPFWEYFQISQSLYQFFLISKKNFQKKHLKYFSKKNFFQNFVKIFPKKIFKNFFKYFFWKFFKSFWRKSLKVCGAKLD